MAIEQLVEEVAANFEEAAEVTRKVNTAGLSYLGLGVGIGLVVGFYYGYNRSKEKLRAEALQAAEEELGEIREVYHQKMIALDNLKKQAADTIVFNQGYSVAADNASAAVNPDSNFRMLGAPVPILSDLPENPTPTSKSKNAHWDYTTELAKRSPAAPYVIHEDEAQNDKRDYSKVQYTYFELDETMVDSEDNQPIPQMDLIVGRDNLKFGHGSSDADTVYVRNDTLNTDMMIVRVNKSYEEEILGMDGAHVDDSD
jgi:hypothetical protein